MAKQISPKKNNRNIVFLWKKSQRQSQPIPSTIPPQLHPIATTQPFQANDITQVSRPTNQPTNQPLPTTGSLGYKELEVENFQQLHLDNLGGKQPVAGGWLGCLVQKSGEKTTWDVENPANDGIYISNWCRISSINRVVAYYILVPTVYLLGIDSYFWTEWLEGENRVGIVLY